MGILTIPKHYIVNTISFSREGKKLKDIYLNFNGVPTSVTGFPINNDSKIKSIFVLCKDLCSAEFRILDKNFALIHAVVLSSEAEKLEHTDFIVYPGNLLRCYMETGVSSVSYPLVVLSLLEI